MAGSSCDNYGNSDGSTRNPNIILEVGGGLGYLARELGKELLPFEKQTIKYLSLDITQPFLKLQVTRAKTGGWNCTGTRANGEALPFNDNSIDLVIDNENMADMTPVKLTRKELAEEQRRTPSSIRKRWIGSGGSGFPSKRILPEDVIFNLGPIRFLAEAVAGFEARRTCLSDGIRHRRRLAGAGQTAGPHRIRSAV